MLFVKSSPTKVLKSFFLFSSTPIVGKLPPPPQFGFPTPFNWSLQIYKTHAQCQSTSMGIEP